MIGEASSFNTKIMGVSFEGRQDIVAGLVEGGELELRRAPDNPKDVNAIEVRFGALQLGFLRKEIARRLAPLIDGGARYRARISALTGGSEDRHRGVNIVVWRMSDGTQAAASTQARTTWNGDAARIQEALIGKHVLHDAQRAIIERVDAGQNTLAVCGTGRGKSFCFQFVAALRALNAGRKTLVIYPLRALANDQHEALIRKLGPLGLRIFRANGSIQPHEREALFAALETGEWDLILSTPEFLEFHRGAFGVQSRPALVVVDEAHHLLESKHRAAYAQLGGTIASLGRPQTLALTATAGNDAFEHVVRELHIGAWVIDPTVRENLRVIDARGARDKIGYLRDLFSSDEGKAIVYCNSRPEATKVAEALRKQMGDVVMFYHAGMPGAERLEVERFFREGGLRIIIATSAFGEGIDLPDIRRVVLYHLNFNFTEFNQQAGRAGRDGIPAEVHLLFGREDRRINEFIIDREAPTLPVLREIYREVRGLARGGMIRMGAAEIARTLDLDRAKDATIGFALRIFEDEGLAESGLDDEGRYIRMLAPSGRKVDLTQNERFAEGEAERESFARFCELALAANPDVLERIISRPIYPERVELRR
jgi:single-stranded-DNA-specific exonuclease